MHNTNHIVTAGKPLDAAEKVMIMVHGRGASAQSILSLAEHFEADNFAFVAPQATGNSWYPYSFLAPFEQNEPGLSAALEALETLVNSLKSEHGFEQKDIFLLGFSQGACLALEYAARHAGRYGGIFALSGGLIGPEGAPRNYAGTMDGTPVYLGCSDVDHHIPAQRVVESGEVFEGLGASVNMRLFKNFGHSINDEEIAAVNRILTTGTW